MRDLKPLPALLKKRATTGTETVSFKSRTHLVHYVHGGVYWTKFECISSRILMRATNRTRGARGGLKLPRTLRLRGDANQCASDTLADSRVQKPKNFLAFSSRLLPPPLHREAEKEMERKFWFCFAASIKTVYHNI